MTYNLFKDNLKAAIIILITDTVLDALANHFVKGFLSAGDTMIAIRIISLKCFFIFLCWKINTSLEIEFESSDAESDCLLAVCLLQLLQA